MNSSRYKLRDFDCAQLLVDLRKKARLTQQVAAQQIGVSTKTLRNWEGGSNYPLDTHLRRLIEVYLDHRAFPLGQEHEEASALWQQFQASTHRFLSGFDERWFARLLAQRQARNSLLNAPVSAPSSDAPANVVTILPSESQPLFGPAVFTKYSPSSRLRLGDWSETIDVSHWYGRTDELAQLQHWLLEDRCRLVSLLGIGGIGKTTLTIKLIQQVASHFDCVLWRSLANAPTLEEILQDWIPQLSEQHATFLPHQIDQALALLIDLLRKRRCLLVLDNLETIFQGGSLEGECRQGYEEYATLIRSIAQTTHQSCLLLTSRELFLDLGVFPGSHTPVRVFRVQALALPTCRLLLQEKGLFGDQDVWNELVQRYAGNPLALKIVAETIYELFDGDIAAFLEQGITIFHSLRHLLAQQFERLAVLEQTLMYWLAIEREPISLEALRMDIWPSISPGEVIDAIQSLHNRSLIERGIRKGLFTLQPVVLEYVTERLITLISEEIKESRPSLLLTHAFLQGQARDYIRASQSRLLVKPMLEKLMSHFQDSQELEAHLDGLLCQMRTLSLTRQGYGGGNVVNLLVQLAGHLKGKDCSHLTIWQADVQVEAQETTFAGSDLTGSVFLKTIDGIISVAFSPDGRYVAAGAHNGWIYLWRAADGQLLLKLSAHTGRIQSLVFTSESTRLISGGYDGVVKVWDLNGETCVRLLQGHTRWIGLMALHPDGCLLATCSDDRSIRLWELETGECLKVWHEQNLVLSVAWSPDGLLLASSYEDGTIKLWDQVSKQYQWSANAHQGWPAASLAFSPDGERLVSGGEDATIRVWQVRSGQLLATLVGHSDRVLSVTFNAQGMLASGSFDHTIKLWQIDAIGQIGAATSCVGTLYGHTSLVFSVAFGPGEVLTSGSLDGTVKLWQGSTGKEGGRCLRTLRGHSRLVTTVVFSPDGRLLLSEESNGRMRLWDTMTGRCLRTSSKLVGEASAFTFHPDGRLVAQSWPDSTIKLCKVESGQCVQTLRGHQGEVWTMIFSPDGRFLVSGGIDRTVKLWEVESGQCLATLQGHQTWVWALAWSPNGRMLASGSCDGEMKLWEWEGGTCLRTIRSTRAILALNFASDGNQLLSGNDRELLAVWDVESGDCLRTIAGDEEASWLGSVALSADGNWLATVSADQKVKLWDRRKGDLQRRFTCQGSRPWQVALSADQRLVAAGTEEGTIFLWEWHTGKCLRILLCDRPYEHMNITGITGLAEAQRASLIALGATEEGNG